MASESTVDCGYNYEFVDPVPDECICTICHHIQREPYQVICCGKIYCKSCLEKHRKTTMKCPCCPASLEGDDNGIKFFPDKNTSIKINHLKIFCRNKGRGCKWSGYLEAFPEHKEECPNEMVYCTNNREDSSSKCCTEVQRCDLNRHMTKQCEYRIVQCQYCDDRGIYKHIQGYHLDRCSNVKVNCENEGCDGKVERGLMATHLNKCPKKIIACQYWHAGCNERFIRENTEEHNQQFIQQHLDNAMRRLSEMSDTIAHTHIQKSLDYHVTKAAIGAPIAQMFYSPRTNCKFALKIEEGESEAILVVSVAVMPGRYDHALEWPVKGEVTITVLNQKKDECHITEECNTNFEKPIDSLDLKWHLILAGLPNRDNYVIDGVVMIKIQTHILFPIKPWLI